MVQLKRVWLEAGHLAYSDVALTLWHGWHTILTYHSYSVAWLAHHSSSAVPKYSAGRVALDAPHMSSAQLEAWPTAGDLLTYTVVLDTSAGAA
jgi:hypothetical protein